MPDAPARRSELPADYAEVLGAAKAAVQAARTRVALAANSELILLYWKLGRLIVGRMKAEGWGTKVIDRLSADLRHEFPEMSGLSPRNLKYMRAMAAAWSDEAIVLRVVAQLPWGHVQDLLNKLDDQGLRDWYAAQAVANGWSRAILVNQIKSNLHLRAGAAPTNFAAALPPGQSELVQQIVKDPYNFEFLTLAGGASEREVESGLVADLARTPQELGLGFYYAGRQHRSHHRHPLVRITLEDDRRLLLEELRQPDGCRRVHLQPVAQRAAGCLALAGRLGTHRRRSTRRDSRPRRRVRSGEAAHRRASRRRVNSVVSLRRKRLRTLQLRSDSGDRDVGRALRPISVPAPCARCAARVACLECSQSSPPFGLKPRNGGVLFFPER